MKINKIAGALALIASAVTSHGVPASTYNLGLPSATPSIWRKMFKALSTSAFVAMAFASAGTANAASVTYNLDQSNVLADGIVYLKVTISDSMITAGDIDFKVETTSAFSSSPIGSGSNFGIQSFGFNPSVAITSANIYNLNSKWKVGSGNLGGFGSFAVAEDGTGSSRQGPLTFSIHVTGDSFNSYANGSTGTAGSWVGTGNPYFAAHVAGFTSNLTDTNGMITSGYFAGNATTIPPNAVPVPAAAWLLVSGLLGLVAVARRKEPA